MEQSAPLVLALKKPISLGDQSWDELTLREPTLDEVLKVRRQATDGMEMTMKLIGLVAAVPETALKQMVISDFNACDEYFQGFTQPGRSTGQD